MVRISVVVPVSNSAKTLERCLGSIVKSSYTNYELIVVDDGSTDESFKIASKFTKHLIHLDKNSGRYDARKKGLKVSKGGLIVNIDSDVIVFPDTLKIIAAYFSKNPQIDGITGILSKKHPNNNFTSQYKNLYMNYYFSKLPEKVNFFYGSIYAYRKNRLVSSNKNPQAKVADDTEAGQEFIKNNLKIALLKNLEVIHDKKYNLKSLVVNDFTIPYEWAKIFWKYKGWKQLGRNGTGFAHASKGQIVSLFLTLSFFLLLMFGHLNLYLIILWLFINFDFYDFLYKEKGIVFTIKGVVFNLLDNLTMTAGIICGTASYFLPL